VVPRFAEFVCTEASDLAISGLRGNAGAPMRSLASVQVADPSALSSPQPSTWWQVWQKVRAASLTPQQLASPLMKRPYDLRHSGVTWRLNSSVPATEVAAWASHSVEVLTRVYARCVVGLEHVWIDRMDETLHLGEDR
jgi:integrase